MYRVLPTLRLIATYMFYLHKVLHAGGATAIEQSGKSKVLNLTFCLLLRPCVLYETCIFLTTVNLIFSVNAFLPFCFLVEDFKP